MEFSPAGHDPRVALSDPPAGDESARFLTRYPRAPDRFFRPVAGCSIFALRAVDNTTHATRAAARGFRSWAAAAVNKSVDTCTSKKTHDDRDLDPLGTAHGSRPAAGESSSTKRGPRPTVRGARRKRQELRGAAHGRP